MEIFIVESDGKQIGDEVRELYQAAMVWDEDRSNRTVKRVGLVDPVRRQRPGEPVPEKELITALNLLRGLRGM